MHVLDCGGRWSTRRETKHPPAEHIKALGEGTKPATFFETLDKIVA